MKDTQRQKVYSDLISYNMITYDCLTVKDKFTLNLTQRNSDIWGIYGQ